MFVSKELSIWQGVLKICFESRNIEMCLHFWTLFYWSMRLHWWMHQFWVTITKSPALVSLVLFSCLTPNPQVYCQQSNAPDLVPVGQGTHYIRHFSGLSGKAKMGVPFLVNRLTPSHHLYQNGDFIFGDVNNVTPEQEIHGYNKSPNQYLQTLQFIMLHTKYLSLMYRICIDNFMKTVTNSRVHKNFLVKDYKTVPEQGMQNHPSTSQQDNYISKYNNTRNKYSKINILHNYATFLSHSKKFYFATIFSYCDNVLKKKFIPIMIHSETSGNNLSFPNQIRRYIKTFQGFEDYNENKFEKKRYFAGKHDLRVRRRRSLCMLSSHFKHKCSNEFNGKSYTLRSEIITKVLTENISNLYPTNLRNDSVIKSGIYFDNGKLKNWLNAVVKPFSIPEYSTFGTHAGHLRNISLTEENENNPINVGKLSVVVNLTEHEENTKSSSNTTHQNISTEITSEYHSLFFSSPNVSSTNVSVNFSNNHSNVLITKTFSYTDIPNVFVPENVNSGVTKLPLNLVSTVLGSTSITNKSGTNGDTSVEEPVVVTSSVNTSFPNFMSTLAFGQQKTEPMQKNQFISNVVEKISETVPTPVIKTAKKETEIPVGSEKSSRAALITGVVLAVIILSGLSGTVLFMIYRRYFLNRPQSFNDKCSNPDSSGYIDDSTLRENSEEMYSLDNDSFLNSLEAMTIQNYWTDCVKHTKL